VKTNVAKQNSFRTSIDILLRKKISREVDSLQERWQVLLKNWEEKWIYRSYMGLFHMKMITQ
jgi:hypothetical protein